MPRFQGLPRPEPAFRLCPVAGCERLPAGGPRWAQLGLFGQAIKGGIVGASMVVPGLSVSMLLLALGIYEELLGAVAQLDLAILLPAALGFVPGLVLVSKP